MTAPAIIRDAIVGTLKGVKGVGIVHPYQRYATEQKAFRNLYQQENTLLAWYVERAAVSTDQGDGDPLPIRRDQWRIEGIMALADDRKTALDFDALVERVRRAFLADPDLGGLVLGIPVRSAVGVQITDIGPAMFAGVLVHQAVMSLQTEIYEELPATDATGTVPTHAYLGRAPDIGEAHVEDYVPVNSGHGGDGGDG